MTEKESATVLEKEGARDPGGEKQELLTINQVAQILGVHQQTLRNWERKKLLLPLRVGARRIYTAKHVELCRKIKEYSGKGISLDSVGKGDQNNSEKGVFVSKNLALYTYCRQNPLVLIDPDGRDPLTAIPLGIAVGCFSAAAKLQEGSGIGEALGTGAGLGIATGLLNAFDVTDISTIAVMTGLLGGSGNMFGQGLDIMRGEKNEFETGEIIEEGALGAITSAGGGTAELVLHSPESKVAIKVVEEGFKTFVKANINMLNQLFKGTFDNINSKNEKVDENLNLKAQEYIDNH
jgi:DNA-binding XRE family transcriptional regulator